MEKQKNNQNYQRGITLIALVVTIIVLMIISGITVATLMGENGIIKRAGDAKQATERAKIVENAKLDVLGYQTDNKGGNLEKSQLKAVLDTYFKDVPTLEELPDGEELSNLKLTTLDKYGTHTITVSEIYNGTFSTTNVTSKVPDITKHKWRLAVNGEEKDYCRFDKNGNVYPNEDSEPAGTYSLDGDILTYSYFEFKWDGKKFIAVNDNGEGDVITFTEIIPETFTFTIDGTEYTAEEGMTWEDWVASDYNTGNYDIAGDVVGVGNLTMCSPGGSVLGSQLIDSTIEYWTQDMSINQ